MTQPPIRVADCVAAGTLITTTTGVVPAARLARMRTPTSLVTYNHTMVRFEANRLMAVRATRVHHLRELITESGRSLWCTPDHPIWAVGKGYRPAHSLRPGHEILAASDAPNPMHTRAFQLPWLRGGNIHDLPTQPSVQAPPPAPPRAPQPTLPARSRDWIRTNRAVRLDRPPTAYDFQAAVWPNYIADGMLVHSSHTGRP